MQEYLFNAGVEAELFDYIVVKTRVGRIGTRHSNNVCKIRQVATPACNCLTTCFNRELDAVIQKNLAELADCRWFRTVCERVINGGDG